MPVCRMPCALRACLYYTRTLSIRLSVSGFLSRTKCACHIRPEVPTRVSTASHCIPSASEGCQLRLKGGEEGVAQPAYILTRSVAVPKDHFRRAVGGTSEGAPAFARARLGTQPRALCFPAPPPAPGSAASGTPLPLAPSVGRRLPRACNYSAFAGGRRQRRCLAAHDDQRRWGGQAPEQRGAGYV